MSLAQDIAGSWTLTGVDVLYYNFARPNPATASDAYEENQYSTPLYVSDTHGLAASSGGPMNSAIAAIGPINAMVIMSLVKSPLTEE